MTDSSPSAGLAAKVLTVSDGVVHGTREDRSGVALVERLRAEGYDVRDHRLVADGVERLVSPLGRLSRGIAGIRGQAIILNTPGSPKGCVEQLEAVLDILPHALRLLGEAPTEH